MMNQEKQTSLLDIPLNELTRFHGGESALLERLDQEIESTEWSQDDKDRVNAALAIAHEAHLDDTRGPNPYSTHFLRVAIRILSKNHFAIRDDPELVIVALQHDTIENNPGFYLENIPEDATEDELRELAYEQVDEIFGGSVSPMMRRVTNPPSDYTQPKAERNIGYRSHVREILEADPRSGIIKLSDFIDNCAGLKHNESHERAVRLAGKYLDLIEDLEIFVENNPHLGDRQKVDLRNQLERAQGRCVELLELDELAA